MKYPIQEGCECHTQAVSNGVHTQLEDMVLQLEGNRKVAMHGTRKLSSTLRKRLWNVEIGEIHVVV